MVQQARKDQFVRTLKELGGLAGNGWLREALSWDEATYTGGDDRERRRCSQA